MANYSVINRSRRGIKYYKRRQRDGDKARLCLVLSAGSPTSRLKDARARWLVRGSQTRPRISFMKTPASPTGGIKRRGATPPGPLST